ncbi:MAG TPA: nitroreductase family protein [Acidimicrobiales bacterium]|jgi:nitroreductase|nr:nitroreductase family protein [Acidimicrobiales bacterium]
MELTDVMRTTAAARDFTDQPVSDAEVFEIVDSARFAPSGGNRQPWRLVLVKQAARRARIAELYDLGWREYWAHVELGLVPFAPPASGSWQPAIDLAEARNRQAPDAFGDQLAGVAVMLLLLADLTSLAVTDNGLDRQSIVGGASVYPFAHNILLAARDKGLGGVMTTVLCRQEAAVRDLIGWPEEYALAGLIALGHPVRHVRRLRRKAVAELAMIDSWGGQSLALD